MPNQIAIQRGDRPWAPSGSESVEVFRYYDGPLVGLVRQSDTLYLYQSVLDLVGGVGLWAYTPISDAQAQALARANDMAFDELVHQTPIHKLSTLVGAINDLVDATALIDPADDDPILRAVERLDGDAETSAEYHDAASQLVA